ncbi:CocE/NonD family hydrolase [Alcanivorax sp. JB21]|uniref:CocE/NonD family hydrolase n=1 Tax=Alcanivorax limicola TaxID=2874102 RepID=UPI001CBCBAD8|nr:CocE/NonD family hydrolase [Alcanivorax limicola]MBZ2189728.1 CocE/NonD family hydrolase [Alcanivorax limicola]
MLFLSRLLLAMSAVFLVACGGGNSGSLGSGGSPDDRNDAPGVGGPANPDPDRELRPLPQSTDELAAASCTRGEHLEGGRSYRVSMPSRVDGAAIVFQVFEPRHMDCNTGHPLVLEGHGFGGGRQTEAGTAFAGPIGPLVDAGYAVISIDQRGHGESGGTVRVMTPDFEGQDLIQIVDWAEANLDYLAYAPNHTGFDNLLLGAMGASYGGGFQYSLYTMDPDQRLDAMVPHITWHDLSYSLSPGDGVKSYWGLFLTAAGDGGTQLAMDPLLRASLIEAAAVNVLPPSTQDFLHYSGLAYTCSNSRNLQLLDSPGTGDFSLDPLLQLLAPLTGGGSFIVNQPRGELYPVDVLMFQGFRDSLFTFNEAFWNYQCLQQAGGDVRLLTYPFGHHFFSPNAGFVLEAASGLPTLLGALPDLADGNLNTFASCGDVDAGTATVAWFDEKLRGIGNADDVVTSGQDVCMTLTYGDSVNVPEVTVGGHEFAIEGPGGLPVIARSGALGVVPTLVGLGSVTEEAVIAGIPTLSVTLTDPLAELNQLEDVLLDPLLCNEVILGLLGPLLNPLLCSQTTPPVLSIKGDDMILFAGIGVIRANVLPEVPLPLPIPDLIDEQVFPLRGFGTHEVTLEGIAERLQPGDQLYLMLYGVHPTFIATFSRDLLSIAVDVQGHVRVPLLTADGRTALPAEAVGPSLLPR